MKCVRARILSINKKLANFGAGTIIMQEVAESFYDSVDHSDQNPGKKEKKNHSTSSIHTWTWNKVRHDLLGNSKFMLDVHFFRLTYFLWALCKTRPSRLLSKAKTAFPSYTFKLSKSERQAGFGDKSKGPSKIYSTYVIYRIIRISKKCYIDLLLWCMLF